MAPRNDRALFWQTWIQHPRTVGSVTPSAPALVHRMLEPVPWDRVHTVVELGAGTGPVTAEILQRKPPHVHFMAFEREPVFRQLLAERFPELELHSEALGLGSVLAASGENYADVIISGIPFAALSIADQEALLDEVDRCLAPGGLFIAFQYAPLLYRRLVRRFARCDLGLALLNLPPAVVYTCHKAKTVGG